MVFQKSNPFPTMSIGENVTVGLRLNGIRDRAVLAERIEQSLRMAALWDEVKDRLDESGDQPFGRPTAAPLHRPRAGGQPEVLLMDEPASALDPLATAKIEELILELKKRLHHRHRHAQHAAGRPRFRFHRVLLSGRADRDWIDDRKFSPTRTKSRRKITSPGGLDNFLNAMTRRAAIL